MPGWPYKEWSFLLIPGWQTLFDKPLVEIVARQWQAANRWIMHDLQMLPRSAWCLVHYRDLIHQPAPTIRAIAHFAGLPWDEHIEQLVAQALPITHVTLSAPSADKWRNHEDEIAPVLPGLEPMVKQVSTIEDGKTNTLA